VSQFDFRLIQTKHLIYGNYCKESRGVIEIHVFNRICMFFLRRGECLGTVLCTHAVQVNCIRLSNGQ
jgi:hypothetical protein